ncbi:hypothetical protein BGZ76_005330 [Entomortierella beljakovae]|nr:hypothetical protein BGZ76_005330 [Entomortierella beljakovae]
MVILTDPGRVTPENQFTAQQLPQQQQEQQEQEQEQEHEQRQEHQDQSNGSTNQNLPIHSTRRSIDSDTQQGDDAHLKRESGHGSVGIMIPGVQSRNRSGYINITEDPSAQGSPLWCSKCEHGRESTSLPSLQEMRVENGPTWTHQVQIIGMVVAGIFGLTLVVFTITHVRLIVLNRTTIEDHLTPFEEGALPCFRKGWSESEGERNQGNERLYDLGFKENWEQAMGKGWKCIIPVRFNRPEGPIYNQKVVARQWRDYHKQVEIQKQQQQQQQQQQTPHQSGMDLTTETSISINETNEGQVCSSTHNSSQV